MHVFQPGSTDRQRRKGRGKAWLSVIHGALLIALLLTSAAGFVSGTVFPPGKPEWSVEFGPGTMGPPVQLGPPAQAQGLLLMLHDGQILLLGPQGERRATMRADMAIESPAVAADLLGDGRLAVSFIRESKEPLPSAAGGRNSRTGGHYCRSSWSLV